MYSVVWLILYTSSLWNPPVNSEYSRMTGVYLRFCVVGVFVAEGVKVLLIFYYLTLMEMT